MQAVGHSGRQSGSQETKADNLMAANANVGPIIIGVLKMAALNIPWKILYSRTQILTEERAAALKNDFNFSPDEIARLEDTLNQLLSRYQITFSYKQMQISQKNGEKEFGLALKSIDRACISLDAGIASLRRVNIRSGSSSDANTQMYKSLVEALEIARATSGGAHRRLSEARREGLSFELKGTGDARRRGDGRRMLILEGLNQFWRDTGRSDGFSSNPLPKSSSADGQSGPLEPNESGNLPKKRGGPLVRFLRYVVEISTDPKMTLDEELIKKEISASRRARATAAIKQGELPR